MKKTAVLLALLLTCAALFGGCSTPDPLIVCSFSGEHDFFTVSNGVFGLCSTDDVFYGGILTPKEEVFSDIAAYSATFFVRDGDKQHTILSMHAEDTTGTPIAVGGDLGKVFPDQLLCEEDADAAALLKNGLFFELTVTDRTGTSAVYLLEMRVTEVTETVQP